MQVPLSRVFKEYPRATDQKLEDATLICLIYDKMYTITPDKLTSDLQGRVTILEALLAQTLKDKYGSLVFASQRGTEAEIAFLEHMTKANQ